MDGWLVGAVHFVHENIQTETAELSSRGTMFIRYKFFFGPGGARLAQVVN